jgi:hypothetical protein
MNKRRVLRNKQHPAKNKAAQRQAVDVWRSTIMQIRLEANLAAGGHVHMVVTAALHRGVVVPFSQGEWHWLEANRVPCLALTRRHPFMQMLLS